MEIVKILKDYARTPFEADLSNYLSQQFESVTCCEPIKNKDFLIKYVQPLNDFIIHTTTVAGADVKRILY